MGGTAARILGIIEAPPDTAAAKFTAVRMGWWVEVWVEVARL